MRGRPPTPVEQRRFEGNRGKRPMPQPQLLGGRQVPKTPPRLSPEQRRAWRILVADLAESGVLDHADAGVVEAAAVFWGRAREARELLNALPLEDRLLSETRRGKASNPLLVVERNSWTEFRQVAEHLGLSPAARTRLGLSAAKRDTLARELEREIGTPPRLRVVGGEQR